MEYTLSIETVTLDPGQQLLVEKGFNDAGLTWERGEKVDRSATTVAIPYVLRGTEEQFQAWSPAMDVKAECSPL